MLDKLKQLAETTNPRVLGLVLKSQKNSNLYEWIKSQTTELGNVSIKEQVYFLLNGKPAAFCKNNMKKTLNASGYGFCGNISKCQCFREQHTLNFKPFDMPAVLEKRKETWIKKYGTENPMQSSDVKDKRLATIQSRDYTATRLNAAYDKQSAGHAQVLERVSDKVFPLFAREEYTGSFRKNKYQWKCNECFAVFSDHVDYGRTPVCKVCYPHSVSKDEITIRKYINSLGFDTVSNTKEVLGNLEYDIYIPSKAVAFEFNGIYWHSSLHKSSKYHVDKFIQSRNLGVHLIQIFEDEWKNKPDIIKSRIKSILGVDTKIAARKCQIKELSSADYKLFTLTHHLQGYAHSTCRYGLYYHNQLVAAMGFSKSRYTKTGYELIRYCSLGTVIGGASKLFAHFRKIHNPECVVSYANRCWSNGKLYEKLGFSNATETDSNTGYWYLNGYTRYHRSNFTKGRLIEMGEDANLTESEIMAKKGFLKIYDCGNYKYIWNSKN